MIVYNQCNSKEEFMLGEREVSADLGENLVDIDIKEDKKKNKLVDFYQGRSRPLIGDEIKIETDEDDKYICFKEGTGNYKLVAQKNTKTNQWRIANFLDKYIIICRASDISRLRVLVNIWSGSIW